MSKPILKLKEVIDRFPKKARLAISKAMPDLATAEMERHSCQTEIKAVGENRSATIYLSTRVVDRDDDIVTPDKWRLKDYQLNSIGIWAHNSQIPAVYKAEETKMDPFGLLQRITFAETAFANDLWLLVEGGFLKTFSAGFRSNEVVWRMDDPEEFAELINGYKAEWPELTEGDAARCDRIITEKTLYESSICNVPSNPMSLVLALNEGKMALEEETKEALKIEEFIQKSVDDGILGKKFAREKHKAKKDEPEPKKADPPTPEPVPSTLEIKERPVEISEVKEIKQVFQARAITTKADVQDALSKSVKKTIDKSRGAV